MSPTTSRYEDDRRRRPPDVPPEPEEDDLAVLMYTGRHDRPAQRRASSTTGP